MPLTVPVTQESQAPYGREIWDFMQPVGAEPVLLRKVSGRRMLEARCSCRTKLWVGKVEKAL